MFDWSVNDNVNKAHLISQNQVYLSSVAISEKDQMIYATSNAAVLFQQEIFKIV